MSDTQDFAPHEGPVGLGEVAKQKPAPSQQDVRDALEADFMAAKKVVDDFRAAGFKLLEDVKNLEGEHIAGVRATVGFVLGHLENCVVRPK